MSAVDQGYRYAINLPCDWVLITSIRQSRLYHKGSDQHTFESFDTVALAADEALLKKFIYLLGAERVVPPSGVCHLDELAIARQYAASRNQTVYVRFITPSTSSYQGYSLFQIWTTNPATGTQVPVDHLVKLPAGIEVSAVSALSPLVSTGNNGLAGTASTMPSGAIAGNYVYFTVRPDGNVVVPSPPSEVNVDTATNAAYQFQPYYFLTLVPVRYDTTSSLPKNYVTIEVNPDTARTQIFRP